MSEPDGYCRQRIECDNEQFCQSEISEESHIVLVKPPKPMIKWRDNFEPESGRNSKHRRFAHSRAHRFFTHLKVRLRGF